MFRIETGNTIGWQVRIEREKKLHSKFFSDSHYDGPEGALAKALTWRDAQLEVLPDFQPETSHLHTPRIRKKAAESLNRTGVIGIGFTVTRQKSGIRLPYVTCHWQDPETGSRRSTSFSIRKHTLRGALKRACRRLREGRGEDPSESQVNYYVRKAYPQVLELFEQAFEEHKEEWKENGFLFHTR